MPVIDLPAASRGILRGISGRRIPWPKDGITRYLVPYPVPEGEMSQVICEWASRQSNPNYGLCHRVDMDLALFAEAHVYKG